MATVVLALTWTLITGSSGWAPPASAHDELLASDPAAGSRLEAAPAAIRLTFREEVVPRFVSVILTVDQGQPSTLPSRVDGVLVIAEVPATAPTGADWSVAYRVVSGDGHPVTGTVDFSVPAPAASTPTAAGSPTPTGAASPTAVGTGSAEPPPPNRAWWVFALMAAMLLVIPIGVVSLRPTGQDSPPDPVTDGTEQEALDQAGPGAGPTPTHGAPPDRDSPDRDDGPVSRTDR